MIKNSSFSDPTGHLFDAGLVKPKIELKSYSNQKLSTLIDSIKAEENLNEAYKTLVAFLSGYNPEIKYLSSKQKAKLKVELTETINSCLDKFLNVFNPQESKPARFNQKLATEVVQFAEVLRVIDFEIGKERAAKIAAIARNLSNLVNIKPEMAKSTPWTNPASITRLRNGD